MMEIAYRFAGFTDEDCPCLATPADGEQRLHLVATRRQPPAALRVFAPVLADARTDAVEWVR
jgi:methoxymalonate biosynthesis protein